MPQFGTCNNNASQWSTWWGAVQCNQGAPCPCPGRIVIGLVNGGQIQPFVNCVLGGPFVADARSGSNCSCADMNANGTIDNDDIEIFVVKLLGFDDPDPACP